MQAVVRLPKCGGKLDARGAVLGHIPATAPAIVLSGNHTRALVAAPASPKVILALCIYMLLRTTKSPIYMLVTFATRQGFMFLGCKDDNLMMRHDV